MALNFNIDIHCHTSSKPYMSGRNNPVHKPFETYENEIQGWLLKRLKKQIENISNVRLATQSNFDNLHQGNVRVIIASLTPLEKAFLVTNVQPGSFLNDTIRDLVSDHTTPWEDTLKGKVVNALTGYYTDDVDFVKKMMLNYFQESLLPEYNYFTKFQNQGNDGGTYKIQFVKNYTQIEETISADASTICVLLSIEGALHSVNRCPIWGH